VFHLSRWDDCGKLSFSREQYRLYDQRMAVGVPTSAVLRPVIELPYENSAASQRQL
jgi:hypothetical protein